MLQNNIFVVDPVVLVRFIIILMAYLLYVHNLPPPLCRNCSKKLIISEYEKQCEQK